MISSSVSLDSRLRASEKSNDSLASFLSLAAVAAAWNKLWKWTTAWPPFCLKLLQQLGLILRCSSSWLINKMWKWKTAKSVSSQLLPQIRYKMYDSLASILITAAVAAAWKQGNWTPACNYRQLSVVCSCCASVTVRNKKIL